MHKEVQMISIVSLAAGGEFIYVSIQTQKLWTYTELKMTCTMFSVCIVKEFSEN